MKLFTRSNDPNTTLGVVERTAYMTGNIGTALVNTIIASFMLFFYTDVLGLNAGIIGTLMLVSRLFDGVTDLIMGMIVDRTHSKHGRARAWVLWMCVPFAISGVLMMMVPGGASDIIKYTYVFITYNLCNAICLTALYVPYNAMTCNMTANPVERGLLGVFVMFGAVAGTMAVQSTVDSATKALGGGQQAWIIVIGIYAAIGCVLHLICFFLTKERCGTVAEAGSKPQKVDTKLEMQALFQNKYWLIAIAVTFAALLSTALFGGCGMYYAKGVMGDTAHYASFANASTLAQMFTLILSFVFIKRFGKRNMALWGLIVIGFGSLLAGMFGTNPTVIILTSALRGIGGGLAGAVMYGLVADTIDYGEWKTGQKSEGVGMAAMTFATKVANGLGAVLIGWLVEWGGYDGAAMVQTDKAVAAINIGFNYIPAVCCAVAAVMMIFYDLDKIYPRIQAELVEHRNKANG